MSDEIERIRLRCVCGDDGCWMWGGSVNSKGLPTIARKVDGKHKTISGRRWVYMASGRSLNKSEVVATTCDNKSCLNPDHLKKTTYSAAQKKSNKADPSLRIKRGRAIKATWMRKGKGWKLTQEQADYARYCGLPSKEVAAELGVSHSLVNYIRRGRVWKDHSSPFAGLGGRAA